MKTSKKWQKYGSGKQQSCTKHTHRSEELTLLQEVDEKRAMLHGGS
jgi:hypothetical protein